MTFMPIFLDGYSLTDSYIIILIQQCLGIPGNLLATKLIGTCLGRKYTTFIAYILAAFSLLIFFFSKNISAVFSI